MTDDQNSTQAGGWIRVPLDEESLARLERLADICGAPTVSVASSLLHDILRDDALAHGEDSVSAGPLH